MQIFFVILGHFLPFYPTNKQKIIIICSIVPEIWCVTDVIFIFHFELLFALLPPPPPSHNNQEKQNFEKMKKNSWRYYHFTHVYHKWQSYDVWFLRYEIWFLQYVLWFRATFYLTNKSKNQNFEKMKKHLEISSFYTVVTKIMIICYTFPEIWHMTDVIFIFHFGLFFAWKIKNLQKRKKHL